MLTKFLKYLLISVIFITHHAYAVSVSSEIKQLKAYYLDTQQDKSKEIKKILDKYQDNPEFNFQLGTLFLKINKPLNAEITFKKLYNDHPKDKYEIAYGNALLAQGKFQDVLYVVKLNALSNSLKAEKYFLHAKALFGLENGANALKSINKALSLKQNNTKMLIFKARTLTKLEIPSESLAVLNNLKKSGVESLEIDTLIADNYFLTKDYLKAKDLYNKILKEDDNYIEAYAGRAKIHLLLNNQQEAVSDGAILLSKDPGNPIGTYVIASALNNQKKYAEALKLYDGRGEANSYFLPGLFLEADINFNNKNYARSQVLLNKYLRFNYNDPKALKLRGILKLQEGNDYDALGYLTNAYTLDSQDPHILIALSQAYYNTNDYDNAEKLYQILITQFPDFKSVAVDAFELSCKLKTVQTEKPKLCKNIIQSEVSSQIFNALGYMYIGNTEKALKKIQKIIKIYPNNATVQKHYARILNISGKTDDAVAILFDILDKTPENQMILSELYTIYKSGNSSVDIINKMLDLFENNKSSVNMGYYLANFFYKNKNYDKAIKITELMLERTKDTKNVHEMMLKIMINQPDKFSDKIKHHLAQYQTLKVKNPFLIRLLRQTIIRLNFKTITFNALALPSGEETAKDYQTYAEYLIFINNKNAAEVVYQSGTQRFSDNFDLFNSAYDFYNRINNVSMLDDLQKRFNNKNNNYNIYLQAKNLLAKNKKSAAIAVLDKQFKLDKHGLIADLLLTLNPLPNTVKYIQDNFKAIKDYPYNAAFSLAKILHSQLDFSEAANLLLPFYEEKKNNFEYKLLLSRTSFYTDFILSSRLIQALMQEYPSNKEVLIDYIAFQTEKENYQHAIYLFDQNQPEIKKYPTIHFYYAYALLMSNKEEQGLKILNTLIDNQYNFTEKKQTLELIKKYTPEKNKEKEKVL